MITIWIAYSQSVIYHQHMGNTPLSEDQKMSQLSTMRNQRFLTVVDEQEYLESIYCCCIRVGRRKYELWRKNLETNFKQLQKVVEWIPYVEKAYRNNAHSRQKDLQELLFLKADWEEKSDASGDATDVAKLIEKSLIVGAGSNISRRNQLRKSVGLNQRTSAARSVILCRGSRSPRLLNRESNIENISQIFANRKHCFDKETADALYLFTLFSDLIEKHFKITDTLFFRMKDTFVDYIANNSPDKDQLLMDIHHFIKLLWETLVDYYKVDSLDAMSGVNSFFTEENMETLATSILFRNSIIHARVFQSFVEINSSMERELESAIYQLRDAAPEDMGIKPPYCLTTSTIKWFEENHKYAPEATERSIAQPYLACSQKLRQLEDTRTPAGKLKILVSTADLIIECINKFYEKRGMVTTLQTLDADQVLSIYSYILVKSRVRNLHAHLNIIQMFSSEGQLLSETGYYFSVVSTALQSLVHVTL